MTRDEAKKLLIEICDNGVKGTDIVGRLLTISPGFFLYENFVLSDLLDELVKDKKILELTYVLPQMSYRTKSFYLPVSYRTRSFYLPVGTQIRWVMP